MVTVKKTHSNSNNKTLKVHLIRHFGNQIDQPVTQTSQAKLLTGQLIG